MEILKFFAGVAGFKLRVRNLFLIQSSTHKMEMYSNVPA